MLSTDKKVKCNCLTSYQRTLINSFAFKKQKIYASPMTAFNKSPKFNNKSNKEHLNIDMPKENLRFINFTNIHQMRY